MIRLTLFLIFALGLCCSASAQIQNPGVVQVGTVIPGNCVKWVAKNKIGDAGAPCGGVASCTAGAIDLSLSTGCNIPFYVGGIFP